MNAIPNRDVLDLRTEAVFTPSIAVDNPALRTAAIATWTGRMVNEHGSAPVFEQLAEHLHAAGQPTELVAQVRQMATEERRHGALCAGIVRSLGGDPVAIANPVEPLPRHDDVDAEEALTRNLLHICCLSETVAVALIDAERQRAEPGPMRDALTEILADEVGHARLGWRWLATHSGGFDADRRARLGAWLQVAFGHVEAHELAHLPLTPELPGGAALGLCSGAGARALFYDTIEQVILPRLEAHGLPARAAWATRTLC